MIDRALNELVRGLIDCALILVLLVLVLVA